MMTKINKQWRDQWRDQYGAIIKINKVLEVGTTDLQLPKTSEAEPVVFLKFTQLRGPAEEGTTAGKLRKLSEASGWRLEWK